MVEEAPLGVELWCWDCGAAVMIVGNVGRVKGSVCCCCCMREGLWETTWMLSWESLTTWIVLCEVILGVELLDEMVFSLVCSIYCFLLPCTKKNFFLYVMLYVCEVL